MATVQIPASLAQLGYNNLPPAIEQRITAAGGSVSQPEQGDGANPYAPRTISFEGASAQQMTDWLIDQPEFYATGEFSPEDIRAAEAGQPTQRYNQAVSTATTRGNTDNSSGLEKLLQTATKVGPFIGAGGALAGMYGGAGAAGAAIPEAGALTGAAGGVGGVAPSLGAVHAAGVPSALAASEIGAGALTAADIAGAGGGVAAGGAAGANSLTNLGTAGTAVAAAASGGDQATYSQTGQISPYAVDGGDQATYDTSGQIKSTIPSVDDSTYTKVIKAIKEGKSTVDEILKTFGITGSDVVNAFKGIASGYAQTIPYSNLSASGGKANEYMTNAGYKPNVDYASAFNTAAGATGFKQGGYVDPKYLNMAQENAGFKAGGYTDPKWLLAAQENAGFKAGGIGAKPTALYDTYSRFLKGLSDGSSVSDSPYFQAINKQGLKDYERGAAARGLNMSSGLIAGLQDKSQENYAKYATNFSDIFKGGATTESDVWNTSDTANTNRGNLARNNYDSVNTANINAGNLANRNYDSVNTANLNSGTLAGNLTNNYMASNNNNAATGISAMGADMSLADRQAKIYGGAANNALYGPTPAPTYMVMQNGQMIPFNTTGK